MGGWGDDDRWLGGVRDMLWVKDGKEK